MIEEKDLLLCGKFFRTHALKGELNVVCEGVSNEILDEGYPLIVDMNGIFVPFYVETFRPKGTFGCLISLDGVNSVEAAQEFVNKDLYLLKKDVAEFEGVDEDELISNNDFIGYRVEVAGYGYVGRIKDIDTSTSNWLLIVRPDEAPEDGSQDIYIPFNEEFFVEEKVDEENPSDNTLTLDLPDGVLDLNKK